MKLLYTLLLLALWGFMFGTSLTGCATSQSDRHNITSKEGPRLNEKKVWFDGTIQKNNGHYTIKSNGGQVYDPINLASGYHQDGLRVRVFGVTRGAAVAGGQPLDIVEIGTLSK